MLRTCLAQAALGLLSSANALGRFNLSRKRRVRGLGPWDTYILSRRAVPLASLLYHVVLDHLFVKGYVNRYSERRYPTSS